MESNEKMTEAVALAEIARFAEAMDLDLDPKGMDDEDRKSLEVAKRRLVKALQGGQLVFDDKGQPIFTPTDEKAGAITFKEPRGSSLIAMDQRKKDHDVERIFTVMSEVTGKNRDAFANMSNRDIKVCLALMNLFLG
jgi:hypothetical protein